MPNNSPSINLVQNKQIPFIDKFMNWSLTVGRLIIILTEILAMMAFIYRFSLDEKLIDLHAAIKQKQALISLMRPDENKYRNLQDRIALALAFSEKSIKTNTTLKDVTALTPQGAKINSLTLNKDRISMNINVGSTAELSDFVNPLKDYPAIKSISIDNIENKPSAGLSVDITAMLK